MKPGRGNREKCKFCQRGYIVKQGTHTNRVKEYKQISRYCDKCGKKSNVYQMDQERAQELLNYEKAYWKIKGFLEKYY